MIFINIIKEVISKEGYKMKIKEYRSRNDIDVIIYGSEPYTSKNKKYIDFKLGRIKYPFHPTVCGVGYYGVERGEATKLIKDKALSKKSISTWRGVLRRCYGENESSRHPSYKDVSVCSEWHDYRNFAKWFEENYYEVDEEQMHLDKDILIKGNRVYSPDACVYVTKRINQIFQRQVNIRSKLPIGVYDHGSNGKYIARYQNLFTKKFEIIGCRDTPEEAFLLYKDTKEDYIKKIANLYGDKIHKRLYDALMNYEVSITD